MIVSFVSAIEVTIVATAMPTIVGALGDFDLFSWVFTAYLLTQGVTVPIYGRLCDFYGRKRVLYFGLVFFVLGSLLCGFAWSMPTLIAFRVVQGLGRRLARDRVADHGQRSLSAGRARQGAGLYLRHFRNCRLRRADRRRFHRRALAVAMGVLGQPAALRAHRR